MDGIFVAGVATGPKDIPDAIVEAGAAAMEAAMYLDRTWSRRAALVVSRRGGITEDRDERSETKLARETLKVFRERMGGLTEAKKAMAKDQRDTMQGRSRERSRPARGRCPRSPPRPRSRARRSSGTSWR